ncbi:alpha/beta hydrolase [Sphingomonas gellani]|uniref:alpha/beta hydrolase n=1 Tax=Sphingomonas gellani TaxID=1166340 RepID=UPI000AC87DBF|nr:alpha/beta hydrolase-fold protein [Sphingomonas gellani]
MSARVVLPALLLAAGAAPALPAQERAVSPAPYTLPNSAVFVINSAAAESYTISVAWPDGAPPAAGWPVLYVLDGEDNFAIAAVTARRLAHAGARSGVEAGVVVGIDAGPLARRVRDYTPATPGWTIPAGRPASGLATGGGEAFLDLIATRVQPAIRARWRVDATRDTLLGHSFGAVLALHAALTRPALFDHVVAVSPSTWFGDDLLTREATAAPSRAAALIAEGDGGDAAAALATRMAGARFLALPGQSHGTTMLAAMAPAVTFAFGNSAQ